MDQMCPNWPQNGFFVSFLQFKSLDSTDFAYSSSFLLFLTASWRKMAEHFFYADISYIDGRQNVKNSSYGWKMKFLEPWNLRTLASYNLITLEP